MPVFAQSVQASQARPVHGSPGDAVPDPASRGHDTPSQTGPFDGADWITVQSVPLLDSHVLTNQAGQPQFQIDARFLQDVAKNANARFARSGDAVPGILGHTSDNPSVDEKPVKCWFTRFHVGQDATGKPVLFADQHVKRRHANILEEYPRRSVELWVNKREIDPVALLGGTTPERDLGVTRYGADRGPVIRYSRRDRDYLYRYSLEQSPMFAPTHNGTNGYNPANGFPNDAVTTHGYPPIQTLRTSDGRPVRYFDDGKSEDDGDGPGDSSGTDPMIAKLIGSAAFKAALRSMIDEVLGEGSPDEGMEGDGDMMSPPGGPPGAGGAPPMGGPPGAPPMGGPGMDMGGPPGMPPGMPPKDEAAGFHGPPPVKFSDVGGYASGSNTFIPSGGQRSADMTQNYQRAGYPHSAYPGYPVPQEPYAPPYQLPASTVDHQARTRLSRVEAENQQLKLKLARSAAREYVRGLMDEGYAIDDPNYLSEQLANFEFVPNGIQARNEFIERIVKKNFARKDADPTAPVDIMRFSRTETQAAVGRAGPAPGEETQRLVRYARENGIGDMAQAWAQMNGSPAKK